MYLTLYSDMGYFIHVNSTLFLLSSSQEIDQTYVHEKVYIYKILKKDDRTLYTKLKEILTQ